MQGARLGGHPAFFMLFFFKLVFFLNVQFLDSLIHKMLYSNFLHPNAHKGSKSWLALHAVPHGGMTNDRIE